MKKITLIIALAFFISSNAQNVTTNGTILLDDATSRTRVVVDAFLNSSNKVHDLIEEIAPSGGGSSGDWQFVTNTYQIATNALTRQEAEAGFTEWVVSGLVDGEIVISPPSFVTGSTRQWNLRIMDSGGVDRIYMALSDDGKNATNLVFNGDRITATRTRFPTMADLDGLVSYASFTNDVCNIVTNEVGVGDWNISGGAYISSGLAPDGEDHYNVPATISEISCYTNSADVPLPVSTMMKYITGDPVIENWLPVYSTVLSVDSGDIGGTVGKIISSLVVSSGRSEYVFSGNTVSHLHFENDAGDMLVDVVRESLNALGLARLSDLTTATNALHKSIAPTISNTVTKAYVEGLGIEAGISASTATNIAEAVGANLPYLPDNGGNVYGSVNIYSDLSSTSVATDYLSVSNEAELKDTIVTGTLTLNGDDVATTNYANTAASNAVANADTTYRRTIGLTNLNQSVQYVNITNTEPSPLVIEMPTDGRTKDWIVYVYAATNVTLTLPSSMTYWMADTDYTNDVPPATPTAFYFSQITTNIFYLGRQELTEVAP